MSNKFFETFPSEHTHHNSNPLIFRIAWRIFFKVSRKWIRKPEWKLKQGRDLRSKLVGHYDEFWRKKGQNQQHRWILTSKLALWLMNLKSNEFHNTWMISSKDCICLPSTGRRKWLPLKGCQLVQYMHRTKLSIIEGYNKNIEPRCQIPHIHRPCWDGVDTRWQFLLSFGSTTR